MRTEADAVPKCCASLIWDDGWCPKFAHETATAITHTISQTGIPAQLHIWITNTLSVEMLCPQRIAYAYISVKT